MNHFFSVSFLVLFSSALAAQIDKLDEQVLTTVSQRMGVEIKSTEFFRVAPPETAWLAFGYLSRSNASYGNVNLAKSAGQAIAENPGVEKYVTEGITKLPHDFFNDKERRRFLIPLGDVQAPWALKLLGHYLMDETPMKYPDAAIDYDASPNQMMAFAALSRMGFSDAPTHGRNPQWSPVAEKAWRQWWKENEGRIEQRIREINPGYYPPQPAATATPATPTPAVAGEYASTPAISNTPKPTPSPSATPVAAVPARQSDWAIYAIGGLVALAALVAVGWAIRRR